MKRSRLRFILAAGVVATAAWLGLRAYRAPRLPYRDGRSFYEWAAMVRVPAQLTPEEHRKAVEVVRELTPKALPFLIAELQVNRPTFRNQAAGWWNRRIPGSFLQLDAGRDRGWDAAFALEIVGSDAAGYLPELSVIATNNPTCGPAALMAAGSAAIPVLTNLLARARPPLHENLVIALLNAVGFGRVAPEDTVPALTWLVESVRTNTGQARLLAAHALGVLHQQPEICLPALLFALDDPSLGVRLGITHALADFPGGAAASLPYLEERFDRGDVAARVGLCDALQISRNWRGQPAAVELARRAVHDSDENVRIAGLYALPRVAMMAESLPALRQHTDDPSPRIRKCAFALIGGYGTNALDFAPLLRGATNDPAPEIRDTAQRALRQVLGLPAGIPPRRLDRSGPVPTLVTTNSP